MTNPVRVAVRLGAVMMLSGLAAGCTNSSSGQPLPTNGGLTTASTVSSSRSTTSSSRPAPARPRDLRLDGKDPCALVPKADWPKFHIERPGEQNEEPTFKSPDCFYSNSVGSFSVTLVITEGIEKWTDGTRSAVAAEAPPIAGFPAISLKRSTDKNECDIAVDVANGQYLLATVIVRPSQASQVPERCEYAHQLAESAMSTLVAGA